VGLSPRTAAEHPAGVPVDHDLITDPAFGGLFSALELSNRDLDAIGDGFRTLLVGRGAAGNRMVLGDLELRDDVAFSADHMEVRGQVHVTGEVELSATTLTVSHEHLHAYPGHTDSGVTGNNLKLEVAAQALVEGWLRALGAIQINAGTGSADHVAFKVGTLGELEAHWRHQHQRH